jgi:hypothetical protein
MPSHRHIRCLVAAVFVFVSFAFIYKATGQKDSSTSDQKQIVTVVNALFAVIQADDTQELDSIVTSDFYIFDGGGRG